MNSRPHIPTISNMVLCLLVVACGGSGFAPSFDAIENIIAGVVQKGPLEAGA